LSHKEPASPGGRVVSRRRPLARAEAASARPRWGLSYALGAVLLVGLLGVPRGVEPSDVPAPRVYWPLHQAQENAETELLAEASEGLPFSVRVVGELLRRLGRSEAQADPEASGRLRDQLARAAKQAAKDAGGRPLLALRALQTHLFLRALGEYRSTGRQSTELYELSGALLHNARRAHWLRGRQLGASDAELAAMFRIRWAELTKLSHASAFRPTLNDLRLFYAHRLRYPDAGNARSDRINAQLDDVRALGKLDPSYPADFAAGILYYQLGSIDSALAAFRAHLRAHPDGEWTLRARNYATACAEQLFQR
jgi:tetratricopeptide (TPR) repeat protein